jgi:Lon-like ATP-dependent protease
MSEKNFGKDTEEWKWSSFESTEGFPVSSLLMDWVIGQDRAIEECKLCIDEWTHKLLWLKEKEWWKAFQDPYAKKPQAKDMIPAGPFVFLVGDAGTGKSLIGRAMAGYMDSIYKNNKITLFDILAWKNADIPAEPLVSIHNSPEGKAIFRKEYKKSQKKSRLKKWGMRLASALMVGFGGTIFGTGLYQIWFSMNVGMSFASALSMWTSLLVAGGGLMFSGIFINFLGRMLGAVGGNGNKGIGGAISTDAPKLIVDNSSCKAPFVDATGHGSAQLFGSVAWDPYQTGGLGTPEHQRVTAGDIHRANMGVLFIDEIKNLAGHEAVTLLTVLEDGQLPITLRGQFRGSETSAMAVSTEPVPAMFFFMAAGNLDSLPEMHHALLDRIQGYGRIIYMNDDMPNNVNNRRKIVQFIAQEVKRFHLLPFSRDACLAIIDEFRKKSGKIRMLSCKFRPMIGIIKTASVLAKNDNKSIVTADYIQSAICDHCKTVGKQILERAVEREKEYRVVNPKDTPKIGLIHGLAVQSDCSDEMIGSVCAIKASMQSVRKDGEFIVTGVEAEAKDSWVQDSIRKVRTVIAKKYGIGAVRHHNFHIDFTQSNKIDGPSAGITMTLALVSLLEKKPIRQDVAVTGEINIDVEGTIKVTPIGGAYEKARAAESLGFKEVVVPKKNFNLDITPSDFSIKISHGETLEDYMKVCLVDQ